ncbi:1,4-beta-xylanase [Pontivivens insulae]|nr:1,4-beta-xylanase [Pontivivens insulae]
MARWSEDDAKAWWARQPWICGFNFLPSSAVNFIEMWHPPTFDRAGIERELGWAADIGFNAMRFNLPFVGWQEDREGLLNRVDAVLEIGHRLGIRSVPCLFDDCEFGGSVPVWGPQQEPIAGVHNSRAVASPGRILLQDTSLFDDFERYVQDVITRYGNDPRVLFWDLYNEPGNRMEFDATGYSRSAIGDPAVSLELMERSFLWARALNPTAPLTVAAWTTPLPDEDAHPYQTEIDRVALLQSDIVTFHAYWNRAKVEEFIAYLEVLDRPMLCTEWMARAIDSRIEDQLGLFRERGIGCFQWGMVKGRSQTELPWPRELVAAHGGNITKHEWFHDLLHRDGTPYLPTEIATIRSEISQAR